MSGKKERRVVVGIPTLNRPQGVLELIRALGGGTIKPAAFFIVDNGPVFHQVRRIELDALLPEGSVVHAPFRNIGVAASWNRMMRWAHATQKVGTTLVLANDDITVAPHTLERLLSGWHESALFTGPDKQPFSFLAIDAHTALEDIGEFDEQFFPAYYEDDDYRWRAKLGGWEEHWQSHVHLGIHTAGGGTTEAMDAEGQARMRRHYLNSRRLYESKWGGFPPYERYTQPYDPNTAIVRPL